jgi:NTE family protein
MSPPGIETSKEDRMNPSPRSRRPAATTGPQLLDLALQGGGSHGAYTWGVLDRLLEDDSLEFAGISGTSAGAMNAVALAAGLMEGGREGARRTLRHFWTQVGAHSPFAAFQPWWAGLAMPGLQSWQRWMRESAAWWGRSLAQSLSPYGFNPLNLNPLRRILEDTVDFERVRRCHKTRLFIAATRVSTGELRVFRQDELSADVVLASACLPMLFQAVDIDGEPYWDGGYAGNPSLMPLIQESPADDLLLVQINPRQRPERPTQAAEILDRINEITFNASLLKELRAVQMLKNLIAEEGRPGHHYRNPLFARVEALRVHRIDGDEVLRDLGAGTKLRTDPAFLWQLFDKGRAAADAWLRQHRAALGRRATLDLQRECLS